MILEFSHYKRKYWSSCHVDGLKLILTNMQQHGLCVGDDSNLVLRCGIALIFSQVYSWVFQCYQIIIISMHKVSKHFDLVIQLLHIRLGVNNTFQRTNLFYNKKQPIRYYGAIQIAIQLSTAKESITLITHLILRFKCSNNVVISQLHKR